MGGIIIDIGNAITDATNDTVKYAMCALFSLPSCPIHRIERRVKSIKGMNMVISPARQSMKFTDVSSLPIFGVFISGFVCGGVFEGYSKNMG